MLIVLCTCECSAKIHTNLTLQSSKMTTMVLAQIWASMTGKRTVTMTSGLQLRCQEHGLLHLPHAPLLPSPHHAPPASPQPDRQSPQPYPPNPPPDRPDPPSPLHGARTLKLRPSWMQWTVNWPKLKWAKASRETHPGYWLPSLFCLLFVCLFVYCSCCNLLR